MTVESHSVRSALTTAIAGLTALSSDPRLSGAEQALCGELAQVDQLALNALRPDETIQPGQRGARAQAIEDKVGALSTVEEAHEAEIGIAAFYNMLDLSLDCAGAVRIGSPTFLSDLSTVS